MGFSETLIFYLLIGLAVAVAMWLAAEDRPANRRLFPAVSALFFWPLYIPVLLAPNRPAVRVTPNQSAAPRDALAASIAQVEGELDAALSGLDGWAEDALSRQSDRIEELKAAWTAQAERIRELDRLLGEAGGALCGLALDHERLRQSEQSRRQNLRRLSEIRDQAQEDLTANLASVRELVTMIHLARFTGAPASRAEELVSQIASAVEGLSEVATWRERPARELHPGKMNSPAI